MEPEEVRELIVLAGERFSGALELARLASPAPRIDAELLRAIRLHAAPHVDAGAEADLWFGPLVESRGAGAVTLDESLAASLRDELAVEWSMGGRRQQRVRRARVAMDRVHASLSPALALEERLAWMAIEGAATSDLEDELWSAVRALADPSRPGVAHWANQAWPRLPAAAQSTRAGLLLRELSATQLESTAGPGQGERSQGDIEAGIADALRAVPLTPLGLDWTPGRLRLGDVHGRDAVEIMVPDIDPHWIELSWIKGHTIRRDTALRTVEVRLGRDAVAVLEAPASDRLRLVTASGDVYEVTPPSAPADTPKRSAPQPAPAARRSIAADGVANRLESWVTMNGAPFWWLAQRIPPLDRRVNRLLMNSAMTRAPAPRLAAEYVSVPALSDQRYAGRLLPPPAAGAGSLPPAQEVAQLFRRNGFVASPKSTLLFAFFAQWFSEPFVRSGSDYSGQRDIRHTEAAQHLDLSQLYGPIPSWTDQLRAGANGLLKSQWISGEEYPPFLWDDHGAIKPEFNEMAAPMGFGRLAPAARAHLFATGTETGNTHFGLMMLTVLFLREHNRLAHELAAEHPDWSDDRLFDTARNVLIVILIKLLIEEYMNHLDGRHFKRRFDPDNARRLANTRTAVEFNLVYRWHSLVPDHFHVAGRDIPLDQIMNDTEVLIDHGLGQLFDDASNQAAGKIGLFNTNDRMLTSAELQAIEQARASRLGSYNDYREYAGYPRVTRFDQVSSDPLVVEGLRTVYARVDEIEFYVGLLAEDRRLNSVLGPLAQRLVEQNMFTQLMSHPLLEPRIFGEQSFSRQGLATIQTTTCLNDVLQRNIADPLEYLARLTQADWRRV